MSTVSVQSTRLALAAYVASVLPRALRGSIAIIAFVALWEALPRAGWVDATFLPPFSTVLRALLDMTASGELGLHLLASAARAASGFAIAVVIGVPLGLFIGWYRTLADVLNPLLELFRNTAPLALLPASVPAVFTGIRVAGAYSILVLIAAEMVGAKAGLGYLVNYSQFTFEIPKMYAGIVTLALLGLAFNQAVLLAERRLTAWQGAR
jgi:NitT/TauT family transport system permease protein